MRQKEEGGVPLMRGAELAVFLASAMSDGITGKLISAVWDNWLSWPDHLEELGAATPTRCAASLAATAG